MKRLVILGSKSFIASGIINHLDKKNYKLVLVDRKICNFENNSSINKLSKIIKKNDTIIFIAANAPVKNVEMFNKNILICKNIYKGIENIKNIHLIYISSDAVYSDKRSLINETSKTEPDSLHGLMHITRENILKQLDVDKFTILRPTLVYGLKDPHNGYGPNQFFRKLLNNKTISLFGKGEERRDHIHIDDVGKIICKVIEKRKTGIMNLVTGKVISFYKIATIIKRLDTKNKPIEFLNRIGNMPHNGYRAFNNTKLNNFYKKKLIEVEQGLEKMYRDK